MDRLIQDRKPDLVLINKKKMFCHTVNIAVPTDHIVKMNNGEKQDKFHGFA